MASAGSSGVFSILIGSLVCYGISVFLSVRFVLLRRIGPPWLLVSAALLVTGTLTAWATYEGVPTRPSTDLDLNLISFLVSFLFASGFLLTDKWFGVKERLEKRFRLIGDADRALVGLIDEDAILSSVCEALTRGEDYRLAFIALEEPGGAVSILRSAGAAYGFLEGRPLRCDDSPEGLGPTGTALRTGESVAVNRESGEGDFGRFLERARPHGIRGAASVPIEFADAPKMTVTICSSAPSAFDRLEMVAVRALAHQIGTAIQSARRHAFFVCAKSAYDDLLRNQRDGVILVREGRVVRVNPAAISMLGFVEPGDLMENEIARVLVTPENAFRLGALLSPGGGSEGAGSAEVNLRRIDGTPFAAEVTATWLPRGETKVRWNPHFQGPLGMIIIRDISERRQLEAQIIEMQKMEAVGTLAGGVAHDFNNILTGIIGNLDLALESLAPGSPTEVPVVESLKASQRATELVRQLLEFSRRAPIERRALDLSQVAREVVRLFSQTIDRRIGVEVVSADGLWQAAADSNQAHQVIMNLCVNARDAMMERLDQRKTPAGPHLGREFRITIRADNAVIDDEYCRQYSYARPGEYVALSIADVGVGMDAATRKRIFEPFFTTKKLGRGTGLGLSTVYGIVKAHEGWINLESDHDLGTTFRVYFPRATGVPVEWQLPPDAARTGGGQETILLVDDEEMIRSLGRRILEMHGYKVLTADDGQQAVEIYRGGQERVALVIMDQSMPTMCGTDAMRRIRAINPRAKVILSSGYTPGEAFLAPGDGGADGFLQKPYRADSLGRIVREILDR